MQSEIKARKLRSGWNSLPAQSDCLVRKSLLDWEFDTKKVEFRTKRNLSTALRNGENDSEHKKGFAVTTPVFLLTESLQKFALDLVTAINHCHQIS